MSTLVFFLIAILLFLIIRFLRRNSKADNLMKQFGLPLEDRMFLIKKYGPTKLDKWVIEQYIAEKVACGSFSDRENRIKVAKAFFIRDFQEFTKDFKLSDAVTLRFSEADPNVLEILHKCDADNFDLESYLNATVFNREAYENFRSMGLVKIHVIDEKRKSYEVITLDELRNIVN